MNKINKEKDLERFNYDVTDLFGHYAKIEMKFYGEEGNQKHLFKIIKSGMKTNFYNDVPFNNVTNPAYSHNSLVDVVSVIHCGVNETEVYNVPLKDIEILPTYLEIKLQKNEKAIEEALKILNPKKEKMIS